MRLKYTTTFSAATGAAAILFACATSPTGRQTLHFMPEDQMDQMGKEAFAQMKQQIPVSNDPVANALVRCVSGAIVNTIPDQNQRQGWEVVVFQDESPNAFALPGRKIGVHTGMLKLVQSDDELAAVIGHEVAHVLAEHSNERVSSNMAAETGLGLLAILTATGDPQKAEERALLLGLIGLGAQVGVLLPYSRSHETEADKLGLDMMARAGFDPRKSVDLWKHMEARGGGQPPEFLSTHPSHGTRIQNLQARIPSAMALYQDAVAGGKNPQCVRQEPVAQN